MLLSLILHSLSVVSDHPSPWAALKRSLMLSLARFRSRCGSHLFLSVSLFPGLLLLLLLLLLVSGPGQMTEEVTQEVSTGQRSGPGEHWLEPRGRGEGEGGP